jgi:hypothetical protein
MIIIISLHSHHTHTHGAASLSYAFLFGWLVFLSSLRLTCFRFFHQHAMIQSNLNLEKIMHAPPIIFYGMVSSHILQCCSFRGSCTYMSLLPIHNSCSFSFFPDFTFLLFSFLSKLLRHKITLFVI